MVERNADLERSLSSASRRAARMAVSVLLRIIISPRVSEYLASRLVFWRLACRRDVWPGSGTDLIPGKPAKITGKAVQGWLKPEQSNVYTINGRVTSAYKYLGVELRQ
jgi:hypothetical protein